MARPKKTKRVCSLPENNLYGPIQINRHQQEDVFMTVEEYEVMRILDYEGLNQEACAQALGVARSTVQRIYDNARQKIADSIVNGKRLKIQGGDYKLCSDFDEKVPCKINFCYKKRQDE
jgi:predicted DNA-binding protein (UPF0251 family)